MSLPMLPLARASALVLALGGLLAALTFVGLGRIQERERKLRFDALASQAVHRVVTKINLFEYGLRGARGAVVAVSAEDITRKRFRAYMQTRDIEREFAGTHGFGFIRRVRRDDEQAYLQRVRADGAPDFRLHQISEHPGDRWIIEYLEPEEPNREALGLDVASEPRRAAALTFAVRSASAALTAPVTLIQASHLARSGFLLVLPIYRLPVPPPSVAERERLVVGLSYAPILISEVMADFDFDAGSFGLRMADIAPDGREEPFYESSSGAQPSSSALRSVRMTPVYGRTWKIEVFARPAFLNRLNQTPPLLVAAVVLLIALLCALIVELGARSAERRRLGLEERLRLAAIVDSSRDAIVGLSLDGSVMSWNPGAERMFGYPAQQVLGQRIDELIVPEPRRYEIRSMLARIARGEGSELPETERLRSDGSRLDVFVSAFPISMADGNVVGCAMILHDISARKSAERQVLALNAQLEARVLARTRELDEARRLFQVMLDGAPLLIGYWDRQLHNRFANRAYRAWFGDPDANLTGRDILSLLGEKLYAANRPRIDEVLRGTPQVFEQTLPCPDGSGERQLLMHYQPDSQDGEVRGFFVLASDVSELRGGNLRLQRSEAFLQTLLDTIPGLILYCRSDLCCEFASSSSTEWLGASPASLRGRPLSELLDAETYAWYRPLASRVLAGESLHLQRRTKRRDGREADIWVHLLPDIRPGGAGGFLVVLNDVTALTSPRRELLLNEGGVLRDARAGLLARLNHDLRTPLNAVLGYCHLLERKALSVTVLDCVLRIDHSARHLLGIVCDLFDVTSEPRQQPFEVETFRLADTLERLAGLLAPALQERPVELVIAPVPEEAEFLEGDARHLLQILLNLGRNAIRFTPHGSVVISVRTLSHDPDVQTLRLEFKVSDTGVGIAATRLESIFTGFDSGFAQSDGSGLGLAICRELVERMGGRIRVSSEEGQGSEFSVELGFGLHRPESPSLAPQQDLRVLIAEDHPLALQAIEAIVAGFGWRFDAVRDGAAAIETLEREGFGAYQLCLLDWHMPQFDGLTVARHLREIAGTDASPAVLMVSAHERALIETEVEAGRVDALLQKPVTESALYDLALRFARNRCESGSRSASRAPRLQGLRILVVDDNEINRAVAQGILCEEGALVSLAVDGADALHRLDAEPAGFDAVLMDVRMPGMDGYQVTRKIKRDHRFAAIPVIALTAEAFAVHREKASVCGMQGFVAKPFDVDELVEALLAVATPRKAARSALDPVDLEHGLRTFGSDERFRRYLTLFFDDFHREDIEAGHGGAELQALAHRMKSAAGFLGLLVLQRSAAEAEMVLRSGAAGDDALQSWQDAFDKARAWAASFLGCPDPEESSCAPGAGNDQERLALLLRMKEALERDDLDGAEALLDDPAIRADAGLSIDLRRMLERFDLPGALSRVSERIRSMEAEKGGMHD